MAEYAKALGCRVIAYTRHPSPERVAGLEVTFVDLDTLFQESDVISINIALTPQTAGLIGGRQFSQMRRQPILVNTARGQIVEKYKFV